MKKGLLLFWLSFIFIGNIFAQQDVFNVQSVPHPDVVITGQQESLQLRNSQEDRSFTFDDIEFWVGSGSKKTAIAIKWNDGRTDDGLVWGYQWDGEVTLMQALKEIAWEDERLFCVVADNDSIVGIGFDLNGKNGQYVIYNGGVNYPGVVVDGWLVVQRDTNFDKYEHSDSEDHWGAGKTENGVWTYLLRASRENDFILSDADYREQVLSDGSLNALNFDRNFEYPTIGNELTAVSKYSWEQIDYTKGIFFVNEDWFGWKNGSLNFLKEDGEWVYRAYSRENRGQAFGCTTSYGTIYGDNFYFVSKQPADNDHQYEPGGRLVVADAKTLKKKAGFNEIGGGDGRSFLGIDENTGYIGTSSGIVVFDIPGLRLGEKVTGTEGGSQYAGQIGTMLRIGDYVFACKQSSGILVIDVKKHEVVDLIECKNIGSIVRSKDGYLWATAYADGLWKIDPYTFEVLERREIPTEAQIPSSWGAWSASLICASDKTNTLFWAKMNGTTMTFFGTKVFRYDIDNPDLSKPFYELTRPNEAFYGSAINIDPVTENLVITTTQTGFLGNYQHNWVHFVNSETGDLIEIKDLEVYYWFPTMSAFPDNYAPVISEELTDLAVTARTETPLLDKVSDLDNRNGAIITQVEVVEGAKYVRAFVECENLVVQPLSKNSAKLRLTANSNGKLVSKEIMVDVTEFTSVESVELDQTQINLSSRETYQLTATVYPANASNKTVLWSSGDESVATVDENGVIQPLQSGKTVTITATTEDGEKTAICTVGIPVVSVTGIGLDKESATLDARLNETLQLTPIFTPEDATNKNVTWSSSNPEIVSVDENGLVKALNEGITTITVTSEDGSFEATCEITSYISVRRATLDFTSKVMNVGETHQASVTIQPENATNKNIKEWVSASPELVSVDENGLITVLQECVNIRISAFTEDGAKEAVGTITGYPAIHVTGITLDKESATLDARLNETLQLTPTFTPEDATNKNVIWNSSNPELVSVDENGLVKALEEGIAVITVISEDGSFEATCEITSYISVRRATLDFTSKQLAVGETHQAVVTIQPDNATNKNIKEWFSANPDLVSVDQNGLITVLDECVNIRITAVTEDGGKEAVGTITGYIQSVEEVSITPETAELFMDETIQLSAVLLPENATNKKVSWISSDVEVATVDENGVVTVLTAGEVTITITTEDGEKTATAVIICKSIPVETVTLTPESGELEIGDELQMQVNILPENATNKNIQSWVSSNPEVASVDTKGLVTALAEGQATITVTTEDAQLEATCEILITPATGIEGGFVVATLVYPAVTTNEIFVEQQELNRITILNAQGAALQIIIPEQHKEIIEIGSYSAGIYFIRIGDKTFKVIKK